MTDDLQDWLILLSAFLSVAIVVALAGTAVLRRERLRGRLAAHSPDEGEAGTVGGGKLREWRSKFTSVEDRIVGFDDADRRSKARVELIRAGFFSPDAARNYILIRVGLTIVLPVVWLLVIAPVFTNITAGMQYFFAVILIFICYVGPKAYIERRKEQLVQQYRNVFPDLLDLLIVCMDAGSSLNAAMERVGRDMANESKALALNIQLLVSEMRSGRSIVDALDSFASRVGLDEAASLRMLVKQSVELGADINDALRVYSDEMRDKRLSRAEEKAHALPVKMVVPLGLFIFPVILIVVLTPVALKFGEVLGQISTGGTR